MNLLNLLFVLFFVDVTISLGPQHFTRTSRKSQHERMSTFPYKTKTYYYETRVDKFGTTTDKTFKMRYVVCDEFVTGKNPPILFYTGNEGDIFLFVDNTLVIYQVAQEVGGIVIFAEHRYYGKSLIPYTGSNLEYLSAEYALADYAEFVVNYKEQNANFSNSAVISFGGSYGGMLTAWFRQKYPFIVYGAWAGSAPVADFINYTSLYAYDKVVTDDYTKVSPVCSALIKKSFPTIDEIVKTESGIEVLIDVFKPCNPEIFKTNTGISNLKSDLQSGFEGMAQYDYPVHATFGGDFPPYPVNVSCSFLTDAGLRGKDLLVQIGKAFNISSNYSGSYSCNSFADSSGGFDPWSFQVCNQMVITYTANGVTDMFPNNPFSYEKYSDNCFKTFGIRPQADYAITAFGGRDYDSASNIIFSNGLLDPWHPGGVLNSTNPNINIVIIPNGAHHLDLRGIHPDNPPNVNKIIEGEISIVKGWLAKYKEEYLHI